MIKKAIKTEKEAIKLPTTKYFYAVGKRKSAISRVRMYEKGTGKIFVNNMDVEEYFTPSMVEKVIDPLKQVAQEGIFDISVKVIGGGKSGQAEATRLGVSIALTIVNADFRTTLKKLGYLTRDSRIVERKKPGLKKARKAPQWAKR